MTNEIANPVAQRLRDHARYGRFGDYNDVALSGAQEIDRLQGLLSRALELIENPAPLMRPAAEPSVSRLPVPGATMTRLSDIADELIRQLRKQGMEKMQAVFDGVRLRIDPWPESCTSDCVQTGYPDIDCPVHGKKTPPALPHCASCLCHLGHCQNHPAAVFHPPATCPECASGEPAYALLEVVKSGDGQ